MLLMGKDFCNDVFLSTYLAESQQKLIAEKEAEILEINNDLINFETLKTKFESLQCKYDDQNDELTQVRQDKDNLENQIDDKEKIIGILRQELDPLQENAQSYKEKYEALNVMIEPFREQLESYELERNALLAQKKEAQGQVNKLADQYTNLLGHQNHKQKIHHLVRLKQENLDLREENAKLNLELNK